MCQKGLFEGTKLHLWRLGFAQRIEQVVGCASPQCVQGQNCIVHLSGRQREKGESTARFEVYTDDRLQTGRIEDRKFRTRTADQATAKALELAGILPVIHPKRVVAKVDDKLHRAIWKTAFLCM